MFQQVLSHSLPPARYQVSKCLYMHARFSPRAASPPQPIKSHVQAVSPAVAYAQCSNNSSHSPPSTPPHQNQEPLESTTDITRAQVCPPRTTSATPLQTKYYSPALASQPVSGSIQPIHPNPQKLKQQSAKSIVDVLHAEQPRPQAVQQLRPARLARPLGALPPGDY